jgi:hypothetical protein
MTEEHDVGARNGEVQLGSSAVEHRGRSAALQDSDSSNSPNEAMRSLLAE